MADARTLKRALQLIEKGVAQAVAALRPDPLAQAIDDAVGCTPLIAAEILALRPSHSALAAVLTELGINDPGPLGERLGAIERASVHASLRVGHKREPRGRAWFVERVHAADGGESRLSGMKALSCDTQRAHDVLVMLADLLRVDDDGNGAA